MAIKLIKVGHGYNIPVKTYVVDSEDDVANISNPHFGDKVIIPDVGSQIYSSDGWVDFADGSGGSGGANIEVVSTDKNKVLTAVEKFDDQNVPYYTYEWKETAIPDLSKYDDVIVGNKPLIGEADKLYVDTDGKAWVWKNSEYYQIAGSIPSDVVRTSQLEVYAKIADLSSKQDLITSSNKLDYDLISGTPNLALKQDLITETNKLSYDLISGTPNLETKQDLINESNKLDYSLINGTPDLSTKQDVLQFNTAYNADSNKVATMADINSIEVPESEVDEDELDELIEETFGDLSYSTSSLAIDGLLNRLTDVSEVEF